jgi:hypothetical protein
MTTAQDSKHTKNAVAPKNPFAMTRPELSQERKNIRLEEQASRIGQRVAQLLTGGTPANRGQRKDGTSAVKQLFQTPITQRSYESGMESGCTTGPVDTPVPASLMSSMERNLNSVLTDSLTDPLSDSNRSWAETRQLRPVSMPALEHSRLANRVQCNKAVKHGFDQALKARSQSAEPTSQVPAQRILKNVQRDLESKKSEVSDPNAAPPHLVAAAVAKIQQKCKAIAEPTSAVSTHPALATWTGKDLEQNKSARISFKQENPRRRGTAPQPMKTWELYEKYKSATTVGEFVTIHGKKDAHKTWRADVLSGSVVVEDFQTPVTASAATPAPVAKPVGLTLQVPVKGANTKHTDVPMSAPAREPRDLLVPDAYKKTDDIKSAVLAATSMTAPSSRDLLDRTPQRPEMSARVPRGDENALESVSQGQANIRDTKGRPRRKSLTPKTSTANQNKLVSSLFYDEPTTESASAPLVDKDSRMEEKARPNQERRKSVGREVHTTEVVQSEPVPKPIATASQENIQKQTRSVPQRRKSPAREAKPAPIPVAEAATCNGSTAKLVSEVVQNEPVPKPISTASQEDMQQKPTRPVSQRRKSPAREAKPAQIPVAEQATCNGPTAKLVSTQDIPVASEMCENQPVPKPIAAASQTKEQKQTRRRSPAREAKPAQIPVADEVTCNGSTPKLVSTQDIPVASEMGENQPVPKPIATASQVKEQKQTRRRSPAREAKPAQIPVAEEVTCNGSTAKLVSTHDISVASKMGENQPVPKPVATASQENMQNQTRPVSQRRKSGAREAKPAQIPVTEEAVEKESTPKPVPTQVTEVVPAALERPEPQRRKSPGRPKKVKENETGKGTEVHNKQEGKEVLSHAFDTEKAKEETEKQDQPKSKGMGLQSFLKQQSKTPLRPEQVEQQKVQDQLAQQLQKLQQQAKEQQERLEQEKRQKDKLREQLQQLQQEHQPLPSAHPSASVQQLPQQGRRRKSLPPSSKPEEPKAAEEDPVEPPQKRQRRKSLPAAPHAASGDTLPEPPKAPKEATESKAKAVPVPAAAAAHQEEKPKQRRKSLPKAKPSVTETSGMPRSPQKERSRSPARTPPGSPQAEVPAVTKQTRLRRKSAGGSKESQQKFESGGVATARAVPLHAQAVLAAEMAAQDAVRQLQASASRRRTPSPLKRGNHGEDLGAKRQRRSPLREKNNIEDPLLVKSSVHFRL